MLKTEQNVVIDAPVEAVCNYITDPTHMFSGADEVEIKDVQRLPNGGYHYTAGESLFLGLHTTTICDDVEAVANERAVTKMHSALMDGTASWRFERLAGDKTRVSFVEEVKVHGGPLGKLGEAFFAKSFKEGVARHLETAKAHIEAEAKAAAPS